MHPKCRHLDSFQSGRLPEKTARSAPMTFGRMIRGPGEFENSGSPILSIERRVGQIRGFPLARSEPWAVQSVVERQWNTLGYRNAREDLSQRHGWSVSIPVGKGRTVQRMQQKCPRDAVTHIHHFPLARSEPWLIMPERDDGEHMRLYAAPREDLSQRHGWSVSIPVGKGRTVQRMQQKCPRDAVTHVHHFPLARSEPWSIMPERDDGEHMRLYAAPREDLSQRHRWSVPETIGSKYLS
jgi:hypothetical protein